MTPALLSCWGLLGLCLWWTPSAGATPLVSGLARSEGTLHGAMASLPLTPAGLPSDQVLGQEQVPDHSPRSVILPPPRATPAAAQDTATPRTHPTPASEGSTSPRLMHTTSAAANATAVASSTTGPPLPPPPPATLATAAPTTATLTSAFEESTTSLVILQNPAATRGVPPWSLVLGRPESRNFAPFNIVDAPYLDCPNECEVRIHRSGECILDFACEVV